jgi:hypothetical protein
MRIIVEVPSVPNPDLSIRIAMPTFANAADAVGHMERRRLGSFDSGKDSPRSGCARKERSLTNGERLRRDVNVRPACILTRPGVAEFLGNYWDSLDDLPFQLMREIVDDSEPNDDGSLNFTSVDSEDIETIHEGQPCGAEIREFVERYEIWQLWMR